MPDKQSARLANLWDDRKAAAMTEPERLVYRSNLLGSDKRVTNYGGGNTSSKVLQKDPLTGEDAEVLWVKGSGGDSASIKLDGFATLYMDKLRALKGLYRGLAHEDEMVGYLPHCTFNLNPRAASIDTPLHAYVPKPFVDHMHPDAIIALAAARDSRELTRRSSVRRSAGCRGNGRASNSDFGWKSSARKTRRPRARFWKATACSPGRHAGGLLHDHDRHDQPGDRVVRTRDQGQAGLWRRRGRAAWRTGTPCHRGAADAPDPGMISSSGMRKIGHFDNSQAVLEFVNSRELDALAALGTSCPDHFLRTKIRPLVIGFDPAKPDIDAVTDALPAAIEAYRVGYQAYYDGCKHPDSPAMRDPNAVVYLMPGVGMFTFAADKATARVSAEFYVNAINVMRGASAVSSYVGLPAQEAFDIEYWPLEEAKLQRLPKPKSLAGQIAFVTGGAGGIGKATAIRLLREGACVVLADIDEAALTATHEELGHAFGKDFVRAARLDVTDESGVAAAYADSAVEFGGVDILVSNAGISSSAPIEDTELSMWNRNMDILAKGYFLVSREAFRTFKQQKLGGNIVFIASKNGLAASPNAAAYCTAKAAEIHLARCLALEGAEHQIRVNTVNPDAVLRGSKIWTGEWREQRAAAYAMQPDDLEEHYRKRSMLKRSVFPEDIAEAVYFLASDMSAKSTGNIINVDAGNAQSFTR